MSQYDFSQLSPFDFEMMVAGLLQKEWECRLEAFKSGRDQGIDLRYAHPFSDQTIIVQCKHYANSGFSKLLSNLKLEEKPKIEALTPDRYVLVTSVGLTPANKADIMAVLSSYIQTTDDIIGQTELNLLLEKHPEIEQKNFKLWLTSKAVLDRVLHNAELSRTEFIIEKITRKLPLYVQNSCFPRARQILADTNIVVISGEPGVGKTTLAELLLFSYVEEGHVPVVIKGDLREGLSLFNRRESQVFYYDDFLGQTFLRERHGFLLRNEDQSLVEFMEMVQSSPNSKLVMTTREHILSNALIGSDRLKRSPIVDYRCILQIADYSKAERAKILYNHIYFSELPVEYRSKLIEDNFYESILLHRNFNPRLIEWLSTYRRIKKVSVEKYRTFVAGILENPREIWNEAFQRQISDSARSLLLSLFAMGGKEHIHICEPAWQSLHMLQAKKYNYPISTDGFSAALREVEGSFVSIERNSVEYINPSVKDFVSGVVSPSSDIIEDLIRGASNFDQVSRLYQWSNQQETGPAQSIINTSNKYFLEAIKRTLALPYRLMIQNSQFTAERALDLYPEARLRAILLMADHFESEHLLQLTSLLVKAVFERWDETTPDFKDTVDILDCIEKSDWEPIRDIDIYDQVRKRMFAELSNAITYDEFWQVDEYVSSSKTPISDDEVDLFATGIKKYARSHFRGDLRDICDNRDELESFAGFMFKMVDEYGYAVSMQYDEINDALAELDEREEQRADHDVSEWKDRRGMERASNEEITNMFDSLKG